MKLQDYKTLMETDELLQSIFVLFHIDQRSKAMFSFEINDQMVEIHKQIEDLLDKHPEYASQSGDNQEMELELNAEQEKVGFINQGPFTLIGIISIIV